MNEKHSPAINLGLGADLAFAIVVLTSYFMMFSNINTASSGKIAGLIILGIAYISNGIYGFSLTSISTNPIFKYGYFVTQLILATSIAIVGGNVRVNPLLFLPLTAHSVILLGTRDLYVLNAFIILAFVFTGRHYGSNWSEIVTGFSYLLAGQVFIIVFTQTAIDEARSRKRMEILLKDLETANQQLKEYANKIEEMTLTKERNRLAREIHDGLGHYLTTINMQIQAARAVIGKSPKKSKEILASAQNVAQEALKDVRTSVSALRESTETHLPLPAQLQHITESLSSTGVHIEYAVMGNPRSLNSQTELTLFRATQEGVNNAIKHGACKTMQVLLDYSANDQVVLTISDDGMGADKINPGFGLVGISERVSMLGGKLEITGAPGEGLNLRIQVPG